MEMIAAAAITGVRGAGPMAKAMSVAGLIAGGLIALIFALDLILGIPFGGQMKLVPRIGFIISGAILAYLGWNALADTK
jgi:hypothetical protein